MKILSLALQNFRNFTQETVHFDQTTVLVGVNGIGKTSILEGIYLLATGESFRAQKVEEMVKLGTELGRVVGSATDDDDETTLEVMVTRGMVQGKRTQSRLYSVNSLRKRKKDFLQEFSAVIFRPEDLRLIEGSPGRRRLFLDFALSKVYPSYAQALSAYEQALKRRNKLLFLVREGEQPRSVLAYWDLLVVKHGKVIQEYRQQFLNSLAKVSFSFPLQAVYQPSLITEERLAEYKEKELIVGHSLIGPHKDDFLVRFPLLALKATVPNLKGEETEFFDIAAYGSRGQQRLAVLWLKLGELLFIQTALGHHPVLLLDDIMSELDDESQQKVLALLGEYQVIITTADLDAVDQIKQVTQDIKIIEL